MIEHRETYEQLGVMTMRIMELPSEWDRLRATRRSAISFDNSWVAESIKTAASPWLAWDYVTDPEKKRKYYDMISVTRIDETPGRVGEGSKYHHRQYMGEVTFTITEVCT